MRFFIEHGRRRRCFMKSFVDHDCPTEVLRRRNEYREAKILRENRIRFQTPDPSKLRGVFWQWHSPIQGEATRDVVTACHCAKTYSTPDQEVIQLLSAWCTARGHRERGSPEWPSLQMFMRDSDAWRSRIVLQIWYLCKIGYILLWEHHDYEE